MRVQTKNQLFGPWGRMGALALSGLFLSACGGDDESSKSSENESGSTGEVSDVVTEDDIDRAVESFIEETGVPGLAIATLRVTDDGLRVWEHGYGFADIEEGREVSPHTSFWLGSVSKAVMGTALMHAQEHGRLNLDDRASDLLGAAGEFELAPLVEDVTLRHLVTHTSTIRDTEMYECAYFIGEAEGEREFLAHLYDSGVTCPEGTPSTLGGYLEAYLSPNGLFYDEANFYDASPGEEYEYSNIAAGLAGFTLQAATGQSLSDYAREQLFAPLGMENTSWNLADLNGDSVAARYYRLSAESDNLPIPSYELATWPDGGLRSSVHDLARFLGAMINQGTLDLEDEEAVEVLSQASVQEMLTPIESDDQAVYWAQAILPVRGEQRVLWGHDGSDPGAFSFMLFDPETRSGFVMASNGDDSYVSLESLLPLGEVLMLHADQL